MLILNLQSLMGQVCCLPVTRQLSRGWLRAFPVVSCACVLPLAASAQDTGTPSPQYSTTPSLQYSNTPAFPRAIETNALPPPPPPVYVPPAAPGPRLAGTSQLSIPSVVPTAPLAPLFHRGPLAIQPHLLYRVSYGDGIQASPGQKRNTVVNEVLPGVLFRWGEHWTLDYTSILNFYSSHSLRDTVDNSVTLTGGTIYEDWTLGLSQTYASSSDPLIETGIQTDQQIYSTALSAVRQLGSQTSLQLGANQNFRFLDQTVPGEQLSDMRSWSTMDWLNYQFWPRLGAGIGLGFGYDDLSASPDMTSEQFQGRITWRATDKLNFVLSGGAEDRQFLSSGASDLISPVFSFLAQYSLFEATTFSVSAYRAVSPSFYQDRVTETMSVSGGVHQRLLGKLFLDLNGGYTTVDYHSSSSTPTAANIGNYDSTFFGARLSTAILKRGTAGVFYSVNWNSSGAAIYDYTTTMVGLELSYRY